ncbi:hypothetical protein ACF0H5_007089 [Mactra antiquata]
MDLSKPLPQQEIAEKFISCPLCQTMLKRPKCLPCLHSFCMDCLDKHIVKNTTSKDISFPCPVCQERTDAPEKLLKPDQWAKYFPSNPLIDSMLDVNDLKRGERRCDPCKNTRKRSIAVMWCTSCREALCSTCTNSHRGMRLTRGHVVIEINEIRSKPVAAVIKDEKCPNHDDQFLQFYCADHKEQCCPTCAIVTHRRCESVLEMNSLGKEIRVKQKAEKLLKRLDACLTTQQNVMTQKGSTRDALNFKKEEVLKEIRDLKTKMIELLNDMEKTFINEFDSLHETRINELRDDIKEGQRIVTAISDTSLMLEAALIHGSDSQIFMTYEKVLEDCRKYEKCIVANNNEPKEIVYSFKMDERLKTIANNVKKFGHLSIENDHSLSKASMRDSTARETAIFSARSPFDDLRAVDIFQNGDIVLADRMSKSVLVFYSSGDFVGLENFNSRPWGVAVLGTQTFCVTLPACKEVCILKYANKVLGVYKKIKTDISCFAITNFSGEYLTLQHNDEKEEKGRVQICKSTEQSYHKAVMDITANHKLVQGITFDEATGKIFISTDFDAIECYNTKGRILFRNSYPGYGDFRGLSVDHQSNVYVTSFAGKAVLQLTHEGERIRTISTSPLAPLDVTFSHRGNKMVVVGRSDLVHVYTFR